MHDQRDALCHTAGGDTVPQLVVVKDADLDLDRVDPGEPQRLFELPLADVAQADALDEPVPLEGGKGANARGEGRAGVGSVELVQRETFDAEGTATGRAGGDQVAGPPIRNPAALGAGEPALRRDLDPRAVTAPGRESARAMSRSLWPTSVASRQ